MRNLWNQNVVPRLIGCVCTKAAVMRDRAKMYPLPPKKPIFLIAVQAILALLDVEVVSLNRPETLLSIVLRSKKDRFNDFKPV